MIEYDMIYNPGNFFLQLEIEKTSQKRVSIQLYNAIFTAKRTVLHFLTQWILVDTYSFMKI